MKTLSIIVSCLLVMTALADEAKTNVVTESKTTSPVPATNGLAMPKASQSPITLPLSAAVVSVPFVSTNGYVSQPEQTEVSGGGKAIYNFKITNAGDYLIQAMVNAPDESANSFFVNIDSQPEDPTAIWDMEPTSGFQERTVSWRGGGSPEADEFSPKVFKLTEGAHKLILIGREAEVQLKSISIAPATSK